MLGIGCEACLGCNLLSNNWYHQIHMRRYQEQNPQKKVCAADDRCLHLPVGYFLLVENHIAWDPLNGWIGSQLGD